MSSLRTLHSQVQLRYGDLAPDDFDLLSSSAFAACDIETSGLDYRNARIGTVQLADEQGRTWLVAVDSERRPDLLCALLSNSTPRKIFHYAPFDLGFMRYHWGVRAQNVACTKVLDRLVHPDASSHSLKDVLQRELEVTIEKDEGIRRSNWSITKLSSAQLAYAIQDVKYLIALYDRLLESAARHGVSRLAERSFDYLPIRVETELLGVEDLFAY